jgi:hypothetical protein
MGVNYLDAIDKHRDHAQPSAANPRLTRRRASAEIPKARYGSRKSGKGSRLANAEEAPVVRKKRISTKARRAALRNLKKARAARRGGKRRRKNPVAAGEARRRSSKRKSAKRVRAGKKAARTRKRHKAERRGTKRRSSKRRSSKRRSGHRVSPKRRRAALKAARTRKRRRDTQYDDIQGAAYERKRRRKRRKSSSKRRRKNPVSAATEAPRRRRRKRRKNPVSAAESPRRRKPRRRKGRGLHYTGKPRTRRRRANDARRGVDRRKRRRIRRNPVARERRRHRRSHSRRRRNPLPNPISGMMEFVGGVLGVGTGFGLASLVDRILVTHALTTATTSTQGGGTDAPAVGQIYNSEALLTPIWSSWQRMAGAVGAIAAPLVAARFVTVHTGLKTFFQLAGFGALGRTAGKAMDDAVAQVMSTNASVQRLYAGEIAAKAKMTAAATTALPAIAPGTFAGLPRRHMGQGVVRAFAGAPVGSFAALPQSAGPTMGLGNHPQTQAQMAQPRGGQVPGVYAQNPPDANMNPNATTPFNSLMFNPDGQE